VGDKAARFIRELALQTRWDAGAALVDRFVVGRVTGMDSDEETQAAVAALRQKGLLEEYGGLVRLTDAGWVEGMDPRRSAPLTPAEMEGLRQAIRETIARAERVHVETRYIHDQCMRLATQAASRMLIDQSRPTGMSQQPRVCGEEDSSATPPPLWLPRQHAPAAHATRRRVRCSDRPLVVYPGGQPVGPLAPYHGGEAGAEGCDDGRTG
jgi:hypothetical protein